MGLLSQLVDELAASTPHELYVFKERMGEILGTAKKQLTPEEIAARIPEILKTVAARRDFLKNFAGPANRQFELGARQELAELGAEYQELTGEPLPP